MYVVYEYTVRALTATMKSVGIYKYLYTMLDDPVPILPSRIILSLVVNGCQSVTLYPYDACGFGIILMI